MPPTIQQIKRSAWARNFRTECPEQYQEAIALALQCSPVVIEQRDDHSTKGDFTWAIIPDANLEFWLDGVSSKERAIALCEKMGWPIKRISTTN